MRIPRDMRPLARELRANGFQLVPGRGGHIHIRTRDGKFVYGMAGWPGDRKANLALRTDLRRLGAVS